MSDLGSIGFKTAQPTYPLIMPELPLSAPFNPWDGAVLRTPRSLLIASTVPLFGLRSVLCHTPGVLRFEHPVNAGKTVTVQVQVRKTADYLTDFPATPGQTGYRRTSELVSIFPFLRITRADGLQATDIMADVDDTWDTLQAALAIVTNGALVIELVQFGTLGDATLFIPTAQLETMVGPRCYWADLKAIAS